MKKIVPRNWSIAKTESEMNKLRKKYKQVYLKGTGTGRTEDRIAIVFKGVRKK